MVNIRDLIAAAKCYQTVQDLRWPDGTLCPHCSSRAVIKDDKDDTPPHRQPYLCQGCRKRFDDLTGTIFAGHHQPLRTWVICLYFMGLNLSRMQIAKKLDLNRGDVREVVIRMLGDVKQATIAPLIRQTIALGSVMFTDEYTIYNKMKEWGYDHQTVCHAEGEYARDEDGDGFCEVHVNTLEGFWSLLRSWLRPHRGISQEKLPLYLGFFEFIHIVWARGKSVLGALIGLLVAPPRNPS